MKLTNLIIIEMIVTRSQCASSNLLCQIVPTAKGRHIKHQYS